MIFLDANVVSEVLRKAPDPKVIAWLADHDSELALSTVVIAEITYGIEKIRPDQRGIRLEADFADIRQRYTKRTFAFTEPAAFAYGVRMARAARSGRRMSIADGMIAAVAEVHEAELATRNLRDFATTGLRLVSPWA